jgi:hypothetical protein
VKKRENSLIRINKNILKMSKVKELRRKYEKPSMKVVLLKCQPQLLAGSNGTGELDDYYWNTPGEE